MTTERPEPVVPVQQRAQKKRADLVAAAAAEFSERGYASATAQSITRRAGVAVGTFYRYFRDKDELLRELATSFYAGLFGPVGRFDRLPALGSGTDVAALARPLVRQGMAAALASMRDAAGLLDVIEARRLVDPGLAELARVARQAVIDRGASLYARIGVRGDPRVLAAVLFHMVDASLRAHLAASLGEEGVLLDTLTDVIIAACTAPPPAGGGEQPPPP